MSRMAEMLVERTSVSLRAFRDYDEARQWLAEHESTSPRAAQRGAAASDVGAELR